MRLVEQCCCAAVSVMAPYSDQMSSGDFTFWLSWKFSLTGSRGRLHLRPDQVTSDAHSGLKAALKVSLGATPWQRCQFHLQQNAQSYGIKEYLKITVAMDIKSIFNADNKADAQERLKSFISKYSDTQKKRVECSENNSS